MFPVSSLRQHFQSCESSEDIPSLETVVYIVTDSGNADNSDTNQNTQAPISDPVTTDMDFSINNNIAPENAHVDLHISDVHDIDSSTSIMNEDLDPQDVMSVVSSVIHFGRGNSITDPVEILRKLQEDIVTGRPLEIADVTQSVEGDTNFILVDRDHVLTTGFDKLHPVSNADHRKTLEVQFYNETAVDLGGPRKEFFVLILRAIKEKYFDQGLRDLLCADYEFVGKVFALSILQNGKLPTFMSSDILQDLIEGLFEVDARSYIYRGM
ncbi:hypothetical protein ScPMuIL_002336 [Solemya velum]